MSSLGVVTNGVPGLHANPLRDRAVLLLLFAQDFLDFERFLRRLFFFLRVKGRERFGEQMKTNIYAFRVAKRNERKVCERVPPARSTRPR